MKLPPTYFSLALLCAILLNAFFVIPLFILLLHSQFIRHEERAMEEQFGEAYVQDKTQVRRWI